MEISERIKQRMKALSLKAVNISTATGASKGSVSQWINGVSKPSGDYLVKLSSFLKCSTEWLLFGKEYVEGVSKDAAAIGFLSPWDESTTLDLDEVELPFYAHVSASAGQGACDFDERTVHKLRFSKTTLRHCGVDCNYAICMKVTGNSMEPVLPKGSTIGIDRLKTNIEDGKMFAIDQEGMLRVKVLYHMPGGAIRIRSFNFEEYPDEIYNFEQAQNIKIIGKIFWSSILY